MISSENILLDSFFKLLRIGLDTDKDYDIHMMDGNEWNAVINIANRFAVIGFIISGIEKLHTEKRPQKEILLPLISQCLKIEETNKILNKNAVEIFGWYEKNGFRPIIMKGQGNGLFYKNWNRRMPGDIDIWVTKRQKDIKDFILDRYPNAKDSKEHIQYRFDGYTTVEVHTIPSLTFNPFSNKLLHKLYKKWENEAMDVFLPENTGSIRVPSMEMDRVYMLQHKYRHFLVMGLGLKQFVDYMMLLRKGFTEEEKRESVRIIKKLNMGKFCRAVMYVLKEKFGMEDRYLLMEPDCKAGEILMEEILTTGNFGFYDGRYKTGMGYGKRLIYRLKRRWMMVRYFGTEPLWDYYNRVFGKEEID